MTEQEVKEIIARDMELINDSPFPESLPPWLLENFDTIIMETPQHQNPYFAATVKSILGKKKNPQELTFYEGGFVLNVLTSVAPKMIAKNLNLFLDRKAIIEKIMYNYNRNLKMEERKLERKEQSLLAPIRKKSIITAV